ncbi:endonuclease [Virgibacillus dakarensis]|nr:endonuclease [Virgibacillus dakarensis]
MILVFFAAVGETAPSEDTTNKDATPKTEKVASKDVEKDSVKEKKAEKAKKEETNKDSEPEKKSKEKKEPPNDAAKATAAAKSVSDSQQKTEKKASASSSNQVPVTLVKTVDGDTIKVNYKGKEESVRYLLIDTPESKKPGSCVQPFAESSYNRNKQLVNSGKLTLEFEKSERDKYGRLLAYVYVDGKSVQKTLVKEGYARIAYIYEPPYKHLSEYQSAENTAKSNHAGIWSKSGLVSDSGFNGCASGSSTDKQSTRKSPGSSSSASTSQNHSSSGTTNNGSSSNSKANANTSSRTENFQNCTELRKKYPNGVPKGHAAYQDKMDRDKDNFACER